MYKIDDITEEIHEINSASDNKCADLYHSRWWVFPDGLHLNQNEYRTKEDALKFARKLSF